MSKLSKEYRQQPLAYTLEPDVLTVYDQGMKGIMTGLGLNRGKSAISRTKAFQHQMLKTNASVV